MNFAFVDIGELGWSLCLSAHVRWLKKNTDTAVAMIVRTDRKCLYEGLADVILDVPEIFYDKFESQKQNCFGLTRTTHGQLKDFFFPFIPTDYYIPDYFIFGCKLKFGKEIVYGSYKYSNSNEGNAEILIFPRYRKDELRRNIPKSFYEHLIETLCDEFPELKIRTIGIDNGAYHINVSKPNYINGVGPENNLQEFIDRCQTARAAIGSQSSPPKISLLQGVPTFMIGHERDRHVRRDNWMGTKVGFYEINKGFYNKFNFMDCITKIVDFMRGCA